MDWTGREMRADERGAIPADLEPTRSRLGIGVANWVSYVEHFGRGFHRAAGRLGSVTEAAARSGRRWFAGASRCRLAFG